MDSAPQADAYFQRIADEIARARGRGEIPPARSAVPPLHPYPETFLRYLGSSFRRVARRIGMPGDAPDWDPPRDEPATSELVVRLFDEVAHRRSRLAAARPVRIEGWAVAARDGIERIALVRPGWRGPRPKSAPVRPVELASLAVRRAPSERLSFRFDVAKATGAFRSMQPTLVFTRESGATTELPLPEAGAAAERDGIRVAVTAVTEAERRSDVRRGVRWALWRTHALLVRALTLFGGIAVLVLLLPPWRGRRPDLVMLALGLIAVVVASRVAMLTVVDASSLPAWSSRYVYPVVSLYSCGVLLLMFAATRHWKRRRVAS